MPSFAVNVLSLPHGCKELNMLAETSAEYPSIVLSALRGNSVSNSAIVSASLASLRSSLLGSRPCPSAEEVASALRSCTMLSEAAVAPIAAAWEECNNARDIHAIGTLQHVSYRIGVAASSSACKQLTAPYVALTLHILSEGKVKYHTMELTFAEFQEFLGTIREIGSAMDVLTNLV